MQFAKSFATCGTWLCTRSSRYSSRVLHWAFSNHDSCFDYCKLWQTVITNVADSPIKSLHITTNYDAYYEWRQNKVCILSISSASASCHIARYRRRFITRTHPRDRLEILQGMPSLSSFVRFSSLAEPACVIMARLHYNQEIGPNPIGSVREKGFGGYDVYGHAKLDELFPAKLYIKVLTVSCRFGWPWLQESFVFITPTWFLSCKKCLVCFCLYCFLVGCWYWSRGTVWTRYSRPFSGLDTAPRTVASATI